MGLSGVARLRCEVGQAIPDRDIPIRHVEGVRRGTGRWTFEKLAEGTRAGYQIDLEPQGWPPAAVGLDGFALAN